VWGLACPWRLLKPLCLGPACDPARRVGSRVRERKHTDSLCWVGTKGRGALFGSPWRGPRICGQAHTGSGQASRVARRHARSCKRSVLGPVDDKRAPGVELLDRRPTAASGRAALPATAFFWFLGDRFLVSVSLSFGSGGWRLEGGSAEARWSKIGKPRWIQNNARERIEKIRRGCGSRQEPQPLEGAKCSTLCCGGGASVGAGEGKRETAALAQSDDSFSKTSPVLGRDTAGS
jgi:hypothetical protein